MSYNLKEIEMDSIMTCLFSNMLKYSYNIEIAVYSVSNFIQEAA